MTETNLCDRPILLVDDEPSWLMTLELMLARKAGVRHMTSLSDSRKVMETLANGDYALVLLDYTMPHLGAVDLLQMIGRDYPDLPVIVLTGRDQVETAVECMRAGAVDYFIKSHEEERLVAAIRRILAWRRQKRESERLKQGLLDRQLAHPEVFAEIIHQSTSIASLCLYIEAIADGRSPVLLEGESGTGKELFARALHQASAATGEWVVASLAGLNDEQLTDLLFGHEAEWSPGVSRARRGLIAKAAGGTLFLDEIGHLSEGGQLRLLRVLQEGQYYSLGSDQPHQARARFVVSTNLDLKARVAEGLFRRDLYFRLQAHHVRVPPLRDRTEDVPLLLENFLGLAAAELGKKKPTPPPELAVLLQSYHFPGNVRELRNMVFDAVSRHSSRKLSTEAFREAMGRGGTNETALELPDEDRVQFGEKLPTIKGLVRQLVLEAMERAQGNQTVMAEMLGISRPALNKRLKQLREEGVID